MTDYLRVLNIKNTILQKKILSLDINIIMNK